jgi:hypothetical protein
VEAAPDVPDAETTVDLSAPAAAAGLDATPGDGTISLVWTNPEVDDLDAIEIWAALWADGEGASAYPEYDDVAPAPTRPASRAAAADDPAWSLIGTLDPEATTFLHEEGMPGRGVYSYEVFAVDIAGNASPPADDGTWATNYMLGDVNDNHQIDVSDITALGTTYGLSDGQDGYDADLDIGPTDDESATGVPLTDDDIEFEDLMIMALNYDLGKAAATVDGTRDPVLTWYRSDETTWHLGLLEPCAELKGLNLAARLPDGVTVTVEAGSAVPSDRLHFLANIEARGLDAGLAMLGDPGVIAGPGELITVTTSAEVDLSDVVVTARGRENQNLEVALASEPLQVVPDAYRLGDNYPNPFNPQTTIAFDLPETQGVRLAVFDVRGRRVRVLVDQPLEAGSHTVVWDGTDGQGRRVASGVYLYRIEAGPLHETRRMLLVK